MTSNPLSLAALTAAFSGFCFAAAAESGGAPPTDAQALAVRTVVESMTSAFMEGDIDRVMDAYEPGAVVVGDPGAPIRGDAPLRAMFSAFAAVRPVFVYGGHEMIVAGDIALHIAPWTMTGKAPDGAPVEGRGLSVAVMRRGADGQWRMIIDNPHGARLLDQAASD
jgi:uncharacterized protein (TIGR02246 family)